MTATLKNKAIELAVDTLKINGNRITFNVERTIKPDPNTAEVVIYNLLESQRDALSSKGNALVRLAAGYNTDLTQIFYGTLIHVIHSVEGADILTTLSTGDGIEEYRKKRINLSFGPKTPASTVYRTLIKALNLKPGNSDKFVHRFSTGIMANIFLSGTALSGSAAQELTALCRSASLEWSIQDGALQILDLNKAIDNFAIKLGGPDNHGLVGSPSISNKGIVTGKSLILPDMYPGRQIELDSKFLKGRYRLEKCSYIGDTHGLDWYCEFEGKGATSQKKVGSK